MNENLHKDAMKSNMLLREVQDDDLAIFFANQQDAEASHMVAFTKRDPNDRDAFMAHLAKIRSDDTVTIRTIVVDGQVAGNIAQFENEGKFEVGYWIGKKYWGQGIATAALSQFLTEVKVRPLHANVAKDNIGSMRVLEKCGFVIVGHDRNFAKARGEVIDEVIMKLT